MFFLFNAVGLIAFAIAGVFKGTNKNLDILGVSVLGFLTALGGGITRDVLANRAPSAFEGYTDVLFTLIGIIIAIIIYRAFKKDISKTMLIKLSDAIGLATFTVTGSFVGYNAGFNVVGIIVLATLTGTGGGMISDVLTGEIPMILKEDFYASCSIVGSLLFFILMHFNVSKSIAMTITLFFTLILRITAILKRISLPHV